MRNAAALLCALAASCTTACSFAAAVPPGAQLACRTRADCPDGFACKAAVGRCVGVDVSDDAPPAFTGTLTPALAGGDVVVTLAVAADEDLAAAPVPSLETSAGPLAWTLASSDKRAFTFTATTPASGADGSYGVIVDGVDLAGNRALGVRVAQLTIDTTAPAVVPGTVSIFPTILTSDGIAIVSAVVTEPVDVASAVLEVALPVNDGAALLVNADPSSVGTLLAFTVDALALTNGDHALTLTGLVDDVGNAGADAALGTLTVDGRPPVVSGAIDDPAPRYSLITGHNGPVFHYSVDDADAVISVTSDALGLIACDAAGSRTTCSGVIDGAASEGGHSIVIVAVDAAGNRSQLDLPFTLDTTPPAVLPSTVSVFPSPARAGDDVVVALDLSEPPAPGALLFVSGAPAGIAASNASAGTLLAFRFTVPAQTPSGSLALELGGVVDDVGNAAAAQIPLAPAAVVVDADAPLLELVAVDALPCLSLVAPFDHVGFRYGVEAGVQQQLVLEDLALDAPCTVTSSSSAAGPFDEYTCSAHVDVAGGYSDGAHDITVLAEDSAGNQSHARATVVIDTVAPGVVTGSAALTLDKNGFVEEPARLGAGGTFTATFIVTEALDGDTTVVVSGPGVDITSVISADPSGRIFETSGAAVPAAVDGPVTLTVGLRDVCGNAAEVPLPLATDLVLDQTPPSAVDGAVVTLVRSPFGDATDLVHGHDVRASAGAVASRDIEPGATLVFGAGAGSTFIAQGTASIRVDGSFAGVRVPGDFDPAQAPFVVAVVDAAGNLGPVTAVTQQRYLASLGGKRAGSHLENGNSLVLQRAFLPSIPTGDAAEADDGDGLVAVDGAGVSVDAAPRWIRTDMPTPPQIAQGASCYDEARGRTVIYGGTSAGGERLGETLEWDGTRLLNVQPVDPEADGNPHPRVQPGFVYDPAEAGCLLAGGFGDDGVTWVFDGNSYRAAGPSPGLVTETHLVRSAPLGTIAVQLRAASAPALLRREGGAWVPVGGIGLAPPPRVNAAVGVDPATGSIILTGGDDGQQIPTFENDLWSFDGTWHQLVDVDDAVSGAVLAPGDDGHLYRFGGQSSDFFVSGSPPHPLFDETAAVLRLDGDHFSDVGAASLARAYAVVERDASGLISFGGFGGQSGPQFARIPHRELARFDPVTAKLDVVSGDAGRLDPPSAGALLSFGPGLTAVAGLSKPEVFGDDGFDIVGGSGLGADRDGVAAVYDVARNRAVLFGGEDTNVVHADTLMLTFSPALVGQYAPLVPESAAAGQPAPATGAALAYDPVTTAIYLVDSAVAGSTTTQLIYVLDGGGAWKDTGARFVNSTVFACAVHDGHPVFVSRNQAQRTVTSSFDGATLVTVGSPVDAPIAAPCFFDERAQALTMAAPAPGGAMNGAWIFDGSGWNFVAAADPEDDFNPPPRIDAKLAALPSLDGAVLAGGSEGTALVDTWTWSNADERPGPLFTVDLAPLDVDPSAVNDVVVRLTAGASGVNDAGVRTDGAALYGWINGRFVLLGENDAPATSAAALTVDIGTVDPALVAALVRAPKEEPPRFVITSRAPRGTGAASVFLDAVEVEVDVLGP